MLRPSVRPPEQRWECEVDDFPAALGFSADGELVAVGLGEGEVTIRSTADGREQLHLQGHGDGLISLAWHPRQRKLATVGQDGHVRIWRLDQPEQPLELVGAGAWIEHVAWSPDGKRLATSAGPVVQVWTADGRSVCHTGKLPSSVAGLAWNRKGKKLYVAAFGGVRLVDADKGTVTRTWAWEGAPLNLALSPDERHVACGLQDSTVHFWKLPGGDDSEMRGFPYKPKCLSWSHDGRWLAHTGAEDVLAWPFDGKGPQGRSPRQLRGHDKATTVLAYAPQVPLLASADKDGRVLLWTDASDEPLSGFELGRSVEALAWGPPSREGLTLVAANKRGLVGGFAALQR